MARKRKQSHATGEAAQTDEAALRSIASEAIPFGTLLDNARGINSFREWSVFLLKVVENCERWQRVTLNTHVKEQIGDAVGWAVCAATISKSTAAAEWLNQLDTILVLRGEPAVMINGERVLSWHRAAGLVFAHTMIRFILECDHVIGFLPFAAEPGDVLPAAGQVDDTRQQIADLKSNVNLVAPSMVTFDETTVDWRAMYAGLRRELILFEGANAVPQAASQAAASDTNLADATPNRANHGSESAGADSGPGTFDVFLAHNGNDKPMVRRLKKKLHHNRLTVWLDEDQLRPGLPWQELLENGIKASKAGAVLVGKDGLGPWENREMRVLLSRAVDEGIPVIPVLLPGAAAEPQLPPFLAGHTWVDLRDGLRKDGIGRLIWGITDKRPQS